MIREQSLIMLLSVHLTETNGVSIMVCILSGFPDSQANRPFVSSTCIIEIISSCTVYLIYLEYKLYLHVSGEPG